MVNSTAHNLQITPSYISYTMPLKARDLELQKHARIDFETVVTAELELINDLTKSLWGGRHYEAESNRPITLSQIDNKLSFHDRKIIKGFKHRLAVMKKAKITFKDQNGRVKDRPISQC